MRKQQTHRNLDRVIENTLLRWGIFLVVNHTPQNMFFPAVFADFTLFILNDLRRNSINSDYALPFKDFPGIKIYSSSSLPVLIFCCDGNAHHFKI